MKTITVNSWANEQFKPENHHHKVIHRTYRKAFRRIQFYINRPSNINEVLIQEIKYMRDKGLSIRKITAKLSIGAVVIPP